MAQEPDFDNWDEWHEFSRRDAQPRPPQPEGDCAVCGKKVMSGEAWDCFNDERLWHAACLPARPPADDQPALDAPSPPNLYVFFMFDDVRFNRDGSVRRDDGER